jgi:(2R)-ethylmalonyl-CoA mutase
MGYMKQQLVESNTRRLEAIESGDNVVVGVNKFTESEPSPLTGGIDAIMTVSHEVEAEQIARLNAWRSSRDAKAVDAALGELRRAAKRRPQRDAEPSIACSEGGRHHRRMGRECCARCSANIARRPASADGRPRQVGGDLLDPRPRGSRAGLPRKLGRRMKFLVGKPGLDGHSNGAEQIAVRASATCGMEVVYAGIRLTPAETRE